MKRKFKTKNKIKTVNKLILFIFIIYTIISIIYDGKTINFKNILLNSSINEIIKEKSYLLDLIDIDITTPKNIVYASLNNKINKKDLSVFNDYDDYDSYEKNNSVYIEEPNKKEIIDPIVYIFNTHQLEEYNSTIFNDYNIVPNVMMASYSLKEMLVNKGINSIVETNNIKEYLNNNKLNYNYSYRASKYYALEAIKKYPNLKYFIDLHRDSAPLEVTLLSRNNIEYARVLFVVGMDNPNASYNLNFATKINDKLEEKMNGISRGIMKKGDGGNYIFNQDINPNMILLEMGGVDNTIEQVYNTLELVAEVFSEVIKEE